MFVSKRMMMSVLAASSAALLVAGCSTTPAEDDSSDNTTSSQSDPTDAGVDNLEDLVPKDIREKGYIDAVTDASQPPYEFVDDDGNISGLDVELGEAVADLLGLELRVSSLDWSGLIPAVASKRHDVSLVAMFDTEERQEQLDFVDYYIDGDSLIVEEGNPHGITHLDDLCGRNVSTLQGSVMLDLLEDYQENCDGNLIEVLIAPTTAEQLLTLQTGRADATIANGTVTNYSIESGGAEGLEVVEGELYVKNYYGYGFHKDQSELRDAFLAALNVLIENGEYERIVIEWGGTSDNLVSEAMTNQGGALE